ncbi:hypothetical protein [Methanobacterium formicicum]|uniref:Uncharacterized protein n=1 Tax=Methanobacterium formicicum TaxID=2162 RepID=A0A843ATI8_METFO|nr:hypothetical protein [Methanobacterium formicicum]MBF4474554.1 hypothetical protein [Methanobacterium formicicum]
MKSIAADTSFFSCFHCHIKDINLLHLFLDCYTFYMGFNLMNEIPHSLRSDTHFEQKIKIENYDYAALMLPYLERDPKHINDGEYEAIGLAFKLEMIDMLGYLIIDDRKPYNFVKRHFSHLNPFLTGTIGFIEHCCCTEGDINAEYAIGLLETIKELSEDATSHNRPCSMDKKKCQLIIDPVIKRIRSWDDGGL